jgi:hypothetical protein
MRFLRLVVPDMERTAAGSVTLPGTGLPFHRTGIHVEEVTWKPQLLWSSLRMLGRLE